MAKENFSTELKKELALKIVELISDMPMRGTDIHRELENIPALSSIASYSYLTTYFLPKILEEKILGKVKINGRYFVDNKDIAVEMVNDYYSKMENRKINKVNVHDLNTWKNIKPMIQIISSFPGITTGELMEKYKRATGKGLSIALIDKYNEILTLNGMQLDFYERTKSGERMKLSNLNSTKIIDRIISDLSPKTERFKDKVKEVKKSENELNRLSNQDLEMIKINILRVIYLESGPEGISQTEIESAYFNRYNKRLSSNTIQLILKGMVEIGLKYDKLTGRYSIDNYIELAKKISPRKLNLDLVVAIEKGSEFPNLKGLDTGTKTKSCTIDKWELWEVTGYNSKELTQSLVSNVCNGSIKIISPIYVRKRVQELVDKYLTNMNELI